jgi:hypothetical protein
VTADMRHQCERLAERVVEETEPSAPHPRPAREPPSAQDAPSAGDASSAGVPLPTRDSPPAENLLPARSTHVPGDPPVVTAAPAFEPTPSAPATRPVPSPQDDDEPRNPA